MQRKIRNLIKNPSAYLNKRSLFTYQRKFLARHLPSSLFWDEFYMKYTHKRYFGKKLDLENPLTFNEKIRWIMLYDRDPLYTELADKYLVRDFVSRKIGEEYLNPILAVYKDPLDINWDELPNKFAIKMSHGSSMNIICDNKQTLNIKWTTEVLKKWKNTNFYFEHREWHYKFMEPKIIIEKFIEKNSDYGLYDYRFYCSKGQVKYIQVDVYGLSIHTRVFFDPHWKKLPVRMHYANPPIPIEKPKEINKMIQLSEKLTQNINFCRVDFFLNSSKIIFGEITFTPVAGYADFYPEEFDLIFGDLIDLDSKRKLCM